MGKKSLHHHHPILLASHVNMGVIHNMFMFLCRTDVSNVFFKCSLKNLSSAAISPPKARVLEGRQVVSSCTENKAFHKNAKTRATFFPFCII